MIRPQCRRSQELFPLGICEGGVRHWWWSLAQAPPKLLLEIGKTRDRLCAQLVPVSFTRPNLVPGGRKLLRSADATEASRLFQPRQQVPKRPSEGNSHHMEAGNQRELVSRSRARVITAGPDPPQNKSAGAPPDEQMIETGQQIARRMRLRPIIPIPPAGSKRPALAADTIGAEQGFCGCQTGRGQPELLITLEKVQPRRVFAESAQKQRAVAPDAETLLVFEKKLFEKGSHGGNSGLIQFDSVRLGENGLQIRHPRPIL